MSCLVTAGERRPGKTKGEDSSTRRRCLSTKEHCRHKPLALSWSHDTITPSTTPPKEFAQSLNRNLLINSSDPLLYNRRTTQLVTSTHNCLIACKTIS
jgi:hypothetical protein